jgi:hypothetical protein
MSAEKIEASARRSQRSHPMPNETKPIKHIGWIYAVCGNRTVHANFREDLGADRYRRLGVSERFKNERPYRICANCIRVVAAREAGRSR